MRLKDKICLVTGAGGSIGRATSKRLSEEGATVVLSDIDDQGSQKALKEIEGCGGKGEIFKADVTKEDEIVQLFLHIKKVYERLDILANIAGGEHDPMAAVDEISLEKMSCNIDLNLKSCILCCREASKIMMQQRYGKIINMCSIAYRGNAAQITYSAAKGGIYSFTRSMAQALGNYNINVNALAPALIEVDVIKKMMGKEQWEAMKKEIGGRYPLGRVGQPLDVANCILFLASEESSFITGQVIEVSGGARL